jgi:hypothetical protein
MYYICLFWLKNNKIASVIEFATNENNKIASVIKFVTNEIKNDLWPMTLKIYRVPDSLKD